MVTDKYPRYCGRCGLPKQAHDDPALQWIPACPEFVMGTSFYDAALDLRIAFDKLVDEVRKVTEPPLLRAVVAINSLPRKALLWLGGRR